MDDYTSKLSDAIKLRKKLLDKLQNFHSNYENYDSECKLFEQYIIDDSFYHFLSLSKTTFEKLNYVYNNLDKAETDSNLRKEIITILQDTIGKFQQYKSLPNKVSYADSEKFYNLSSEIIKKYTAINSMEDKIKQFYDFVNQKKLEDLQSQINYLSAAIKKITPDDIDNLNFAIKNTQIKAQEIQNLEEQINQKLTDWNSEHKSNLMAEYTKLKDEFNKDINTIKQEVEDVKTETTSQIEQNIKLLSSEYEKKFDNSYTTFNDTCKNNQEKYQELYNNVIENLDNLNNEIKKEELARYFESECQKLKGKVNTLIIASSLFLTILLYQLLPYIEFYDNLFKNLDKLFKPIISFSSIWFLSLVTTQFIYNRFIFKGKEKKNSIDTEIPNMTDHSESSTEEQKSKNLSIAESIKNQTTIKELLTPYWCWLISIFAGMYFIGQISYEVYTKNMENEIHSIQDLLPNMPIFMIMVWFTWFASKQFSYTKQICDEYEYKYALSKSYLSYKNEAHYIYNNDKPLSEENKSLLVSLLDSVIRNIATSPVQSVKTDCHTPFSEVFNAIKSTADIANKNKSKQ